MSLSIYKENVKGRGYIHFLIGLLIRWKQNIKFEKARRIARKRGAQIGEGVVMPISLARKCNKNVYIGSHTSIQTDKIDTRSPLKIGSNVIIGNDTEIITTSHNIDSLEWEHKYYGLVIEDYVWLATRAMILPSCRTIKKGAVIGAGSVVVSNINEMSVVSGNPAIELKKRKEVHSNLIVESLLGGDYLEYIRARKE